MLLHCYGKIKKMQRQAQGQSKTSWAMQVEPAINASKQAEQGRKPSRWNVTKHSAVFVNELARDGDWERHRTIHNCIKLNRTNRKTSSVLRAPWGLGRGVREATHANWPTNASNQKKQRKQLIKANQSRKKQGKASNQLKHVKNNKSKQAVNAKKATNQGKLTKQHTDKHKLSMQSMKASIESNNSNQKKQQKHPST